MNHKIAKKIHPVEGIKISSVISGMYKKARLDLSIVEINSKATVAGVFTQNKAKSPAVIISQKNLKKGSPRFLIINAGNANAGTGKDGYDDAVKYCKSLANKGNCSIDDILVFSTGVIGEKIKVRNIVNSIPNLLKNLDSNKWVELSQSILTTDTEHKIISKKFKLAGSYITITGVTKGSGMIMPNMATMLSFVATDITIPKNILSKLLKEITNVSFNMITVDGDTSTNDSSILIATGKSKIIYNKLSDLDKNKFNSLKIFNFNDINAKDSLFQIKKLSPDLICNWGHGQLFKADLLNIPRIGCLNIHPGLLPYGRGSGAVQGEVINKQKRIGWTSHFMNKKFDSGHIIMQKKIKITATDNFITLSKKILKQEHKLYPAAIMKIFN